MKTSGRIATGMAALLGLFVAVVFSWACYLVAFHVHGREVNGAIVLSGLWAAAISVLSIALLRAVARTDEGWGPAFVSYAIAYVSLVFFLLVVALNHQMG